jgi:hypothetical protein
MKDAVTCPLYFFPVLFQSKGTCSEKASLRLIMSKKKAYFSSINEVCSCRRSRVQRFRGSRFYSHPGLHLGCVFTRKESASSIALIQNMEPNWQLFVERNIFNEEFGSLMPSLSLTLNVEP